MFCTKIDKYILLLYFLMKILSWNVNGIRATINNSKLNCLLDNDDAFDFDILCFQETKAEEAQVNVPKAFMDKYPFRYWNSTKGITQRKGLSGTSIWSSIKPVHIYDSPDFDLEGRITAIEYSGVVLVCVYVPNSQHLDSERFSFRTQQWDSAFNGYLHGFKKPVIVCGDFNVVLHDYDHYNIKAKRNKMAGLYDVERSNFKQLIDSGFSDIFRKFHQGHNEFTYWDQRHPNLRKTNRGWRIDYFLVQSSLIESVIGSSILANYYGSDHCPITIDVKDSLFDNTVEDSIQSTINSTKCDSCNSCNSSDSCNMIETDWAVKLKDEFNKEYFIKLSKFLNEEKANGVTCFPPENKIFSCFNQCAFNDVKVVIIGQDPYHGDNQANGLSFSVCSGVKIPPSLKNIYKELGADLNCKVHRDGNLDSWAKQGVLLLNQVLTVQKGKPNSHKGKGWEVFTDKVIEILNNEKEFVIFMLWGRSAEKKCSKINQKKHCIIKSSHPSPLGATKTDMPFIGSKCFSRCNETLLQYKLSIINWL